MIEIRKSIDSLARVTTSLLFILSGFAKLHSLPLSERYMSAYGLPEILIWPTIAFELVAGSLLFLGFAIRPVALALAAFCTTTALIFHTEFSDQFQMMMFLKNLALTGNFLMLSKAPAPYLSIDGWLRKRRS